MPKAPLSYNQIESLLDSTLDVEFSFLKTDEQCQVISGLPRDEQDFILDWVQRVASTNIQLAFRFITQAVNALDRLDRVVIENWALFAMDMYDQTGLHAAIDVISNVEHFIRLNHERQHGAVLEDCQGVLLHFTHGLSGRKLDISQNEQAHTDTETIFLPPLIATCGNAKDNFLMYKGMVAMLWAQTRYGTFRAPLLAVSGHHPAPEKLQALFFALECHRLEIMIARDLPGLFRELARIGNLHTGSMPADSEWLALVKELRSDSQVTSQRCLLLAEQHWESVTPPPLPLFHGTLVFEKALEVMQRRIGQEKAKLRTALRKLVNDIKGEPSDPAREAPHFEAKRNEEDSRPDSLQVEILLDGQPMPVPESIKQLTSSIIQDLDDIPEEYLQAAGPGEYDPALLQDKDQDPEAVWKGTYHEDGAFLYNEWDHRRQHYRKNWCAVREMTIEPVYDDFVRNTLRRHHGLIKHLRKTFEAMRDENRLLKRQADGDGIDIDALVEALADASDGSEMSDRLFTRTHRAERNIAVVFMVDMSGSTKGWINDAERESLILLCETLETLGDRYAIYGFSGMARKRCEIYRVKTFEEDYTDEIRARISGIQPKDYTRMGFAIRHLTQLLENIDARTRLLVTLSDGKPDDYDNYRGRYGIEDTRRALLEARRAGVHPYCITIDTEAKDYLPHLYGDAAYTVIDEVSKLPLKVSDIYRRLTT